METNKKHNILIVGAGILGITVASELVSMGFKVTLIFSEKNCYLDKIKTIGTKINSALIPNGFGGGSNIWSDLTGFIYEDEWEKICEKGHIENYNYEQFLKAYKHASKYGFISPRNMEIEENYLRHKIFYKSKRKYDFRNLIKGRKNLNIINAEVIRIFDDSKNIKLTLSSSNKKTNINGDQLILAAGGLGNFYLLNLLNKKYNSSKYYGHIKGNIATAEKTKISDLDKYFFKVKKSMFFYYGFCDDKNESYIQLKNSFFINRRSMENSKNFLDKLIYLKMINPVKIILSLIYQNNQLGIYEFVNRENGFLGIFKFIINFVIDVPLIAINTLLKKFKLKIFENKINFCAHITTDGTISLNKKHEIIVDQSLNRYDLKNIQNNFWDFVKLLKNNMLIKNEKLKIHKQNFIDSNHFMGTTSSFLEIKNNGYLKGKLANYENIYTIGTSNIWFKTSVNPTLLTLAFAMITVGDINEKFKK